jgi:hypothetical protein
MTYRMHFLFVSVLALLLSCASNEEKLEIIKMKVESIRNNYDLIRGNKLFYITDNIKSNFTYFLDGNKIAIINEEMLIGNTTNSFNLHFYYNDKIIFSEYRQLNYKPIENTFDKQSVDITIFYDNNGNILEKIKIINQEQIQLSEKDISEYYNHSKKIFNLAKNDFIKNNLK